jgi:hypothetical protein
VLRKYAAVAGDLGEGRQHRGRNDRGPPRCALARQSPYEITAELRPAELGNLAGAIGAAEMARTAQR